METIFFPQVPERIIAHLHPLPPIRLPYTVRVDEAFHKDPKPTIYDVQVQVEDPLRALILKMTSSPENQTILRQIQKIDEELALLIQKMYHIKAKHTFFSSFAKNPVGFIDRWLASQKKDLSVILGELEKGDVAGMEFAKGGPEGVWNSDVVREAVRYRLAKTEAGNR
jgi:SWI/SNF-related matrix-associated actin-dependent regulator of chromatin subfamily D